MKKKLILLLLPTLLVLPSCGINEKENQVYFQEDTLAHEEIFGEAQPYLSARRANELRGNNDEPMIGVQTYQNGENISIRFVAAISIDSENLADTTVTWTRTMYRPDGTQLLASSNKESLKVYTSINNNGDVLTIDDFNEDKNTNYDYFAVYTMLNIPKETYASHYLNAYVTVNGETTETSKVYAARIDQGFNFSFDANANDYFIKGTINGKEQVVDTNYLPNLDFLAYFLEGDTFFVFQNYSSKFKVWTGKDIKEGSEAIENYNGLIRMKYTGQMRVYLDGDEVASNKHYDYYLMGSATGHEDMNQYLDYKFVDTDNSDGHSDVIGCYAALKNVHLYVGDFRIGDADWDNEWGYYGFTRHWYKKEQYVRRGKDGLAPNIYGNINNFGVGAPGGNINDDLHFIHCSQEGNYNIYIGSDGYIYIYYA